MAHYLVLAFRARGRYVCFRLHSHRCRCGVSGRSRGFRRMRPLRGRSHRSGSLALGRRIASGSRHSRSAESAADRESHHQLLYCLVHCRVPFVLCASPFSRLHRVRASRRKFLTKFPGRGNLPLGTIAATLGCAAPGAKAGDCPTRRKKPDTRQRGGLARRSRGTAVKWRGASRSMHQVSTRTSCRAA